MQNEHEHIDDDKLRSLETKGGFSVPEGYFEHSRNAILARALASKDNPQQVEDAYFKEARLRILQQTSGLAAQPQLLKVWYLKPFVQYAAAAVLILSISVGFWLGTRPAQSNTVASVSDEEILRYLQQTDLRDIPITEVSFVSGETKTTEEETYIINQTDEQTILEEL